jgi:hypothetical protein
VYTHQKWRSVKVIKHLMIFIRHRKLNAKQRGVVLFEMRVRIERAREREE